MAVIPGEMKNSAYAKIGGGGRWPRGANKVHYGKCASGEYRLMTRESQRQ